MNTSEGRSQIHAEWGIFLGALGFLLGMQMNGRFQSTLFLRYRLLAEVLPMLLAASSVAVVVCLVIAIIQRSPLKAALVFTGLCYGIIRLTTGPAHFEGGWRDHFAQIRAPMEAAIRTTREAGKTEVGPNRHPLPPGGATLAYDDRVHTYRDAQGQTWFMFLQYLHGVDNGFGYAWSAKDIPPPELAYPQIVRTKRLGNGWYMFYSS